MKKLCLADICWQGGLLLLVLAGCVFSETKPEGTSRDTSPLTLMTWNVHNLFDGQDNGFEYNEFLNSAGWSTEKYLGRINVISNAIGRLEPLPDIIMFQEIESLTIIKDIALSLSHDYEWSHFANNPGAALGLGILSRFPIMEASAHSITIDRETTPRPVLETRIRAGDEEFVIFICHWKSKLGGEDATEDVRKASARVILRRIRELWENEPDLGIIVAGDLNENHDGFYRRNTSIICSLLPDDPYSALITGSTGTGQKDFFVLGKNKPPAPVYFPQETIVLFSPWISELENGSYYFRNNWETIDHFLISKQFFTNTGWNYEKTEVVNFPPFATSEGMPIPYNARTGWGLSDHLPLLLTIRLGN